MNAGGRQRPRQSVPSRALAPLLLMSIMGVSACTAQLPARDGQAAPDAASVQRAWGLRQQGHHEAAAQELLRLASRSPFPHSLALRLQAAEAYLDGNRPQEAAGVLARLPLPSAPPPLQAWAQLLSARAAADTGQLEQALRYLEAAEALDRDGARLGQVRELRAEVYARQQRPLLAAKERLLLEPLLGEIGEIEENRKALWAQLTQASPAELRRELESAGPELRPWLELALVALAPGPEAQRQALLERWQARYPGHGGASLLPGGAPPPAEAAAPRRIGLLLPEEPQFAEVAAALRDGFLTAWYGDHGNPDRASIVVYTTTSATVNGVYDRAVAEGVELIVGPLDRPSVDALARRPRLEVPVLALNQAGVAVTVTGALYQFGLLPEDEARQVAERAWSDGRRKALVITPHDGWGERVLQAFATRFAALGGQVVAHTAFDPDSHDFATPVRQLLKVDESEGRVVALERLLGRDLEAEPRRRQDADFVFLAAYPVAARQIRPQLLFYRAEDLPTYATSHIFVGNADAQRDADLEGVFFGDMPWLLAPRAESEALRALIARAWPQEALSYARLYALGVDAYHLIPHLRALHARPEMRLAGETGTLSMNEGGQIQRQLTWASFRAGMPVPLAQAQGSAGP